MQTIEFPNDFGNVLKVQLQAQIHFSYGTIGWKHIKVEYIVLSQLVGLSIMGHGSKCKWIICEKDSPNYIYIYIYMITLYEFHE